MTDTADLGGLLRDAADRGARYLAGLEQRAVRPDPDAVARLGQAFSGPLPDAGLAPEAVLAELDALASPATIASAGPRYFGFVVGGALPASVAAASLTAAWDQNAGASAASPAAALLDEAALRWLAELLGLPSSCAGALVTGTTMANLTALAAARHALLAKLGWDVEARGLFDAPALQVFAGDEVHASVRKALGLLGLGRDRVRALPVDAQGRIRSTELPAVAGPAIVCAQAGNVNSGASDPFEALRAWCDESGAWLHVDGAFGLFAAASPRLRGQLRGVERADSWAVDAHKWLNVPYDCGAAFVRHAAALRGAMAIGAAYLPVQRGAPHHFTPELSRRARGVELLAALRSLGREGVRELVERCCRLARRFADGLRDAGYEVLNDVVLNQVVVALGDAATCERAIALVQQEGVCWCGPTRWRDRAAMRISVSSWATRDAHVEASLASILRCAERARGVTAA
jgi:glutamate/tyrosine decarboxylase-like PLP-dependent enzyme